MLSRARITGFGLLAGVAAVGIALAGWNISIAAPPAQSGSSGQSGEHHSDPEIHRALHHLHEARHELEHARHDFDGHREAALHAVDDAIKQCETCLKTAHNGGRSSNQTTGSSHPHHNHLSSGS